LNLLNRYSIFLQFLFVSLIILISLGENSFAITEKVTFDKVIEVSINYPDSVVAGQTFTINFIVENTASTERKYIFVSISGKPVFIPTNGDRFQIPRLSGYGSYGASLDFQVDPEATIGTQFLNLNFTRISDPEVFDGIEDVFFNKVFPVNISEKPNLLIKTITPNSIFTDAEFPFEIQIEGIGTALYDVNVRIDPPDEINFRGETQHTFSFIERNTPITMRAQLVTTGQGEVGTEHYIPIEIQVEYTNEDGEQNTDSKTVSLLLRPRTFFEWGPDGGLWFGGVFLAPTISIGTIVGIPGGAILTLAIKRYRKKKKENEPVSSNKKSRK